MRETTLKLWEVACLAGTRAMLGGGAALLLADRMQHKRRRQCGWALFAVGAVSTLPLAMKVRRNSRTVKSGRTLLASR